MKLLSGAELAGFVKARQAGQANALRSQGIKPKLAIIQLKDDPIIDTYVRLKRRYGEDIGVEVEVHKIPQATALDKIQALNDDASVHGIIIQLPIEDTTDQNSILNSVNLSKDVDGLASGSKFDPATPTAILWLLGGYNVDLRDKSIVIVGRGVLVGAPLERILNDSGYNPVVLDVTTDDNRQKVNEADILISATGKAGLIKADDIKEGAVVIDAGVAVEGGVAKGDVDEAARQRDDLKITPVKGGVGPLTVCALFENVLSAASSS